MSEPLHAVLLTIIILYFIGYARTGRPQHLLWAAAYAGLDYLARTTGRFEAASEQERWTAREWLSWEADAITYVAKVRHARRFRTVEPAVMARFLPLAEAALALLDREPVRLIGFNILKSSAALSPSPRAAKAITIQAAA